MSDTVTITTLDNGPLLVNGSIKLTSADGKEITVQGTPTALCRCGSSNNKPFCDGAHKQVGFSSADQPKAE